MASTSDQPEPQPDSLDYLPLSDLIASQGEAAEPYEVVEAEKPKRKRKPKPKPRLHIPLLVWAVVASVILGVVLALGVVTWGLPVSEVVSDSVVAGQAAPVIVNESVPADTLVDRWMLLNQSMGDIPASTLVRVLSADDTPGFYNVADMKGNLTIAHINALSVPENPPSSSLLPPIGPYNAALGKMEKLLVTVEWNGDLAPGTLVYAMGWRAQDGSWIYEVSPDRVKIYYLPWIHLAWASGSAPAS